MNPTSTSSPLATASGLAPSAGTSSPTPFVTAALDTSTPLPPIQLAFWVSDHEVRRSQRTEESLDRVLVPTHHDTLGYRLLAAEPDAAHLLAAWTLLIGVASRLPRPLRGLLVSESGRPHTADDLAVMTGFPAALFVRAFAFFSSPRLGWLVPPSPEFIPNALAQLAQNRAAAEQRARDRAALAAARRAERRKHKAIRAQTPNSDLRSPISGASAPSPLSASSRPLPPPPAPAPTTPPALSVPPRSTTSAPAIPANWRELFLALAQPKTPAQAKRFAKMTWKEINTPLQQRILEHPAALRAA